LEAHFPPEAQIEMAKTLPSANDILSLLRLNTYQDCTEGLSNLRAMGLKTSLSSFWHPEQMINQLAQRTNPSPLHFPHIMQWKEKLYTLWQLLDGTKAKRKSIDLSCALLYLCSFASASKSNIL